MERAYPDDFLRVRPHGPTGDLKCDGYLASARTVFQVYGPEQLRVLRRLLAKIRADYDGAVRYWTGRMDRWVFVHNQDGLPAEAVQLLQDLSVVPDGPAVGVWAFEELRRVFTRMDPSSQRTLVPVPRRPYAGACADGLRPDALRAYLGWLREAPVPVLSGAGHASHADLPVRLAWADRRTCRGPVRSAPESDGSEHQAAQRGTCDLRPFLRTRERLLITGPSGSGKSTVLRRYAAREAGHTLTLAGGKPLRQTPIYVELWRWGRSRTLGDLLLAALTRSGIDFSRGELRLLLDGGGAVLLLDGLDEVSAGRQKDCIAEILTLADRYPASPIIVSSRTKMIGAENFASVLVLPLTDEDLRRSLGGRAPSSSHSFARDAAPLVASAFATSFGAAPLCRTPLGVRLVTESMRSGKAAPRSMFEVFDRAFRTLIDREVGTGRIASAAGALAVMSEFGYRCVLSDHPGLPAAEWEWLVGRALEPLRTAGVVTARDTREISRALPGTWIFRSDEEGISFGHRSFRDFCAARHLVAVPAPDNAAVAADAGVAFFLLGIHQDSRPLLEERLASSASYSDLALYLEEAERVGAVMGRFAGLAHALSFSDDLGIELAYPRMDEDPSGFTAALAATVETFLAFPERAETVEILVSASFSFCLVAPWDRTRTWFYLVLAGLHRLGWPGAPLHAELARILGVWQEEGERCQDSVRAFDCYFASVGRGAWVVAEEYLRELAASVGATELLPGQIFVSPEQMRLEGI